MLGSEMREAEFLVLFEANWVVASCCGFCSRLIHTTFVFGVWRCNAVVEQSAVECCDFRVSTVV